jgi:hypothetical protein
MTYRDGYALPLTLAAIAVIALVAAIAAREVRSATASISALSDQTRNQAALISAEQTMIYWLLTEPMGRGGVEVGGESGPLILREMRSGPRVGAISANVEEISANGAPHRFGLEGTIVRLYDDQSFFNIAETNAATLSRTLSAYGVPEQQHRRLSAALSDFQDLDNRRQLGGAEAADYRDRPPPPNRVLADALEVCAVLGWEQTEVCEDPGRLLLTARSRTSSRIVPALSSTHLLDLLADEGADINAIHHAFATGALQRFSEIGAPDFDVETDPLSVIQSPGPVMVIVSHDSSAINARRTVLEITPISLFAPFVVRSNYVIGGSYVQNALQVERIEDVEPLPEPAANAVAR